MTMVRLRRWTTEVQWEAVKSIATGIELILDDDSDDVKSVTVSVLTNVLQLCKGRQTEEISG